MDYWSCYYYLNIYRYRQNNNYMTMVYPIVNMIEQYDNILGNIIYSIG